MLSLFSRERFGLPQVFAIAFLLAFLGQCLWVMGRTPLLESERVYLQEGGLLLRGGPLVVTSDSRLTSLAASAGPLVLSALGDAAGEPAWLRWAARLPFLGVALLLAASLWYVARRLYGNAGGYIALALFCFSPAMVSRGATVQPDIVAAWGAFGIVFTAIAGTHTLYAPLGWRARAPRVFLLAAAIGLGLSASPFTLVALPLALAFMLYLVPGRRLAALALFGAALLAGLLFLLGTFFFDVSAAAPRLTDAPLLEFDPQVHRIGEAASFWELFVAYLFERANPALLLLFLVSLLAYAAWKRARYFGNTAPLLVAAVFLGLGAMAPLDVLLYWLLLALPFLCVFIAGVFADLLETRRRRLALGLLLFLLAASALFGLVLLPFAPAPPFTGRG